MTITIEAIYEAGVLKPIRPIPELKENEKVFIKFETPGSLNELLANPIQIDPLIAREIAENPDFSLLEI